MPKNQEQALKIFNQRSYDQICTLARTQWTESREELEAQGESNSLMELGYIGVGEVILGILMMRTDRCLRHTINI